MWFFFIYSETEARFWISLVHILQILKQYFYGVFKLEKKIKMMKDNRIIYSVFYYGLIIFF